MFNTIIVHTLAHHEEQNKKNKTRAMISWCAFCIILKHEFYITLGTIWKFSFMCLFLIHRYVRMIGCIYYCYFFKLFLTWRQNIFHANDSFHNKIYEQPYCKCFSIPGKPQTSNDGHSTIKGLRNILFCHIIRTSVRTIYVALSKLVCIFPTIIAVM